MRRVFGASIASVMMLALVASTAGAGIQVNRNSNENPIVEISRSVTAGAAAGLVIGLAYAVASKGDNDGDVVRWCFFGGTVAGLAGGIYFVTHRPQPAEALLEMEGGRLHFDVPQPTVGAAGGVQVPLAAVKF
jgi:hypothetical protein